MHVCGSCKVSACDTCDLHGNLHVVFEISHSKVLVSIFFILDCQNSRVLEFQNVLFYHPLGLYSVSYHMKFP